MISRIVGPGLHRMCRWVFAIVAVSPLGIAIAPTGAAAEPLADGQPITILNVSYDPTRELYKEFNQSFATMWAQRTGQSVTVRMSHGGSGKQARGGHRRPGGRRGYPGAGL